MSKKSVFYWLLGIVGICSFLTPFHYSEYGRIYLGDIFGSGQIDYGRFLLYVLLWTGLLVGFRYTGLVLPTSPRIMLLLRRTGSRLVDLLVVGGSAGLILLIWLMISRSPASMALASPVVLAIVWLFYFAVLFTARQTPGDNILNLVQLNRLEQPIGKGRLLLKELMLVLPMLFILTLFGSLLQNKEINDKEFGIYWNSEEKASELRTQGYDVYLGGLIEKHTGLDFEEQWGIAATFVIIVNVVFQLVMLISRRQQTLTDMATGTRYGKKFQLLQLNAGI